MIPGLGVAFGAVHGQESSEGDPLGEARQDSIVKYRFLAKTARDKKDLTASLAHYEKLLAYEPDYQKGHYYVGRMHFDRGEMSLAKAALCRSAALDSLHRNTNLTLLQIYMDEEQADSSWAILRRLVADRGQDGNALQYRRKVADLYRRQGETRQAIFHYGALVAAADSSGEATSQDLLSMLVRLNRQLGEVDQALSWQRRLLAVQAQSDDGGSPEARAADQKETLLGMIDLMVEQGDVRAAVDALRRLAALDEEGRYSHYSRMFELAEESGDTECRLEALEGKVSANPRDVESLASLIESCLTDAQDIVLAAREAALAEQETALALQEAAVVESEMALIGQLAPELVAELETASQWLTRGLAANPGDPQLHVLKGDLLVLQGDEEGALAAYEVAKGDPNWLGVAQQRIWQIRPPETAEEKLIRQFFRGGEEATDE